MNRDFISDVIAGFSVFLIALPLCLGIALASQYPPSAGIITAIIGGMLTVFFGGAKLSIKGPAAGLIVIALGAVTELGQGDMLLGYERALAVGVIAAILQIAIALSKKGVIAEIMPPSVIHGMLAAIGVIIVVKQVCVMTGLHLNSPSILGLIAQIPHNLFGLNPIVFFVGAIALLITILWPHLKKFSFIPSSIIVISLVIPLSMYFDLSHFHHYIFNHTDYTVGPSFLVHLPSNFIEAIHFPDFSVIYSFTSIKYIIMFTLVGSLESLLTVCAIDTMTHDKPSDLNKDLLATGVGNLASSLIGGLPMISEIVRSKANIDYGAKSARANFFHGLFLLSSVLLLAPIINLIPLSALAALLVFVGLRLASPKEFIHTYHIGIDQFLIFMTTFVVTLLEDLLIGVICGIILKIVIHICRGYKIRSLFYPELSIDTNNDITTITATGPLTFMSYLRLKNSITSSLKTSSKVLFDVKNVVLVDHTIVLKIDNLIQELGKDKLQLIGTENLQQLYGDYLSTRIQKRVFNAQPK